MKRSRNEAGEGTIAMRQLVVLLGLAIALAPWTGNAAQDDSPLDARIGGTEDSFEDRYGDPVPSDDDPRLTTEYEIDGYSTVFADAHEGRIHGISLFAPRPDGDDWSIDASHEMNWSVPKAHQLARRFHPRDAELDEAGDPFLKVIRRVGFSEALESEVPQETYEFVDNDPTAGQFSYVLFLDEDDEDVAWISIELEVEESSAPDRWR